MSMSVSDKYAGPALALVATVIVFALVQRKRATRRPPYPPGPKGRPIIGNLLDFPTNPVWEGFARIAQKYGERCMLYLSRLQFWLVSRLTLVDYRDGYFTFWRDGRAFTRAERSRHCHRPTGTTFGCVF